MDSPHAELVSALLAIGLYLAAALGQLRQLQNNLDNKVASVLAWLGLAAHSLFSYAAIFSDSGVHLGLFEVSNLITWLVVAITLLSSSQRPLGSLLIALLPLAALGIALQLATLHQSEASHFSRGISAHIILSILAYSVLAIAAIQAMALAAQEARYKTHKLDGWHSKLPPLQTMEQMLFELLAVGFALLTAAIVTGVLFVEDMFAQQLTHKTVLTALAWLLFAILLGGRVTLGWRGQTAAKWTLWGFGALLLAFIGTKLVLEFIL